MKILITGGAGYVGGYLVDRLISNGENVTVYDSLVYEKQYLKDVKFIWGDIRDREKVRSLLPQYDVVIWLAALVGDGACAIDPWLTQSINEHTVEDAIDHYDGKFIFPSTCSVYGMNNDLIDEAAVPNPLSAYASTKLAAEQYILKKRENSLVFRLGTLHGLSDQFSRVRFDLVTNVLAMRAAKGQELTVNGGEQWRPLLHVKDVTEAIMHGLYNKISGLYNLHESNMTIKGIADEIAKLYPETKIKYVPMNFEDARNYRVTSQKYRDTGWVPEYTVADGIEEIVRVVKESRISDVWDAVYSNVDYLKTLSLGGLSWRK